MKAARYAPALCGGKPTYLVAGPASHRSNFLAARLKGTENPSKWLAIRRMSVKTAPGCRGRREGVGSLHSERNTEFPQNESRLDGRHRAVDCRRVRRPKPYSAAPRTGRRRDQRPKRSTGLHDRNVIPA